MIKLIGVIKYLFTIVGLGLLIGAFFIYKNNVAFIESAIETDGTVVELVRVRSSDSSSYYYKPVVNFKTENGELTEFISSTGSNPASYSKGEQVKILYLATDPQSAKIKGFFSIWGAAIILGGIGCVFFLVGLTMFLTSMFKNRKVEYLKQHGKPVETIFQSVELNRGLEVNGRNPFRVLTQWQNPTTSEIHIFESNNIWFDPTEYIAEKPITVFIERNNPKSYFVDLSFLPKVAN